MRSLLPVISVLGLLGAGGAVTWSVMAREGDSAVVTREVADAFNLQTGPAPARPSAAARDELRDAVAAPASSLMRPIASPDMAVGAAPKEAPKAYTVITPKAEAWARKNKLLSRLMARPAAFLMARSPLASARSMKAFLSDPKKVDAYMNSPLVRITLNSPTAAKALLGNPAVIRAFLAMPAMNDPRVVRALLGSPMVRKMLDCPAVQEALSEPGVMNRMVSDPKTVQWIAEHPDALLAIASAAPALGDAFTAKK